MHKFRYFLLAICSIIVGFTHSCLGSTFLSVGRPYTCSPAQNYPLSAPPTSASILTDGKYATGKFWTSKNTAGWVGTGKVEIILDLGNVRNVSSVSLNTARGREAEVEYPSHVYLFVGPTLSNMTFSGDIVQSPENVSGPYQVRRFELSKLKVSARYVVLEVVPKGKYFFTDEIEVAAGEAATFNPPGVTLAEVRRLSTLYNEVANQKRVVGSVLRQFTLGVPHSAGINDSVADIERKIAAANSKQAVYGALRDLYRVRAKMLREKFPGRSLLVEAARPWGRYSGIYDPTGIPAGDLYLDLPAGGYGAIALFVTQIGDWPQKIVFTPFDHVSEGVAVSWYQAPLVASASYELVPDPLVPLGRSLTLLPGETKLIFLNVFGLRPGSWQVGMGIDAGDTSYPVVVKASVHDVGLTEGTSLNAINWAYLDFKPIRASKEEAVKDLIAHHTNVAVVPPKYLPSPLDGGASSNARLYDYLTLHAGTAKFLLHLELNGVQWQRFNRTYPFLSKEWQETFLKWYDTILSVASRAGISEDRIYLYPYDEMRGRDLDRYLQLVPWLKSARKTAKFYATITYEESVRAIPLTDISQVADLDPLLKTVQPLRAEMWMYDAKSFSKSLSPYGYYRLMSWKAFSRNMKGVGFWSYADTGWGDNPGTAWDDFDGTRPDFSVVYEAEGGGVVSSRRWEAWRMGIEDYELLVRYQKVFGRQDASALAAHVLDAPDDVSIADDVRSEMLCRLSTKTDH